MEIEVTRGIYQRLQEPETSGRRPLLRSQEEKKAMKFEVSEKQEAKRVAWKAVHDPTCPYEAALAAAREDGDYSAKRFSVFNNQRYTFILTGIGVALDYACPCGAVTDITDYDCW